MLQQILRFLVTRIDSDEFDLLKMQNDTVIAENDILSRPGPQEASIPSAMRSAGCQRRPRGSYCSPLASICHTGPGPGTLKRPAIVKIEFVSRPSLLAIFYVIRYTFW